ncbi:Porphobilinogen deaminase [Labeo rohita]|uniref:Porphobilinogen deaminase n=1 Tax=Labeo rohita TaxID=84645 RepID=A0ABQ8L0N3_LABRO|nr:Porphobilinogen deaminase [Labeo rohita]
MRTTSNTTSSSSAWLSICSGCWATHSTALVSCGIEGSHGKKMSFNGWISTIGRQHDHKDTATGGAADAAALNPLVEKKGGRSHVWKYFVFATDDKSNIIDHQKPTCKRCRLKKTTNQTPKQTMVPDAFEQQKYDKKARKLNRAVAEFTCMD